MAANQNPDHDTIAAFSRTNRKAIEAAFTQVLREQLAVDITKLMKQAEHADATDSDLKALPEELARWETLKAKLDETCARLEATRRCGQVAATKNETIVLK